MAMRPPLRMKVDGRRILSRRDVMPTSGLVIAFSLLLRSLKISAYSSTCPSDLAGEGVNSFIRRVCGDSEYVRPNGSGEKEILGPPPVAATALRGICVERIRSGEDTAAVLSGCVGDEGSSRLSDFFAGMSLSVETRASVEVS